MQGTAVYSSADNEWVLETDEELEYGPEGGCEAYYFNGAESTTFLKVYMNDETAIYSDKLATYSFEDDLLVVSAYLTPMTSRIKFIGTPGCEIAISGISTYDTYNLLQNYFTEYADVKTIKIDENGSSGYIHAVFTDGNKRELIVYDEGKRAFWRQFPENVLMLGSSGYMNIPSLDALRGWTVVNVDNMKEVTFPVYGDVAVLEIKSKSVKVSANVSDCGNGNLLEMGFICSTNSKPSFENGKNYVCEPSQSVLYRIAGLEPETRYYIKPYVVNERGITYGDVMRVVTIAKDDEDVCLDYYNYGEDENWGGDNPIDIGGVGRDDYPDDENWGDAPDTGGYLGKDDYPGDENWGDAPDTDGYLGKDGYQGDEDWN